MIPTLTFDDGPSEWTPQLLDVLDIYGVRAAFFVLGANIAGREDVVARAYAAGHVIGNHTFTHPRLDREGRVMDELGRTSVAIAAITGEYPTVWRAPYLVAPPEALEVARNAYGMIHVDASVWSNDWLLEDADAIADRALAGFLRRGALILMHDGIPPDGGSPECTKSRQPTVGAVEKLLGMGMGWRCG